MYKVLAVLWLLAMFYLGVVNQQLGVFLFGGTMLGVAVLWLLVVVMDWIGSLLLWSTRFTRKHFGFPPEATEQEKEQRRKEALAEMLSRKPSLY